MKGFKKNGAARYSDGQPLTAAMDKVLAWCLGRVAYKMKTSDQTFGDHIDLGLILLKALNDEGFEVLETQ